MYICIVQINREILRRSGIRYDNGEISPGKLEEISGNSRGKNRSLAACITVGWEQLIKVLHEPRAGTCHRFCNF